MLITLWLLGYIELYFGDESGFTMQPYRMLGKKKGKLTVYLLEIRKND
jgi:hypothetical protein